MVQLITLSKDDLSELIKSSVKEVLSKIKDERPPTQEIRNEYLTRKQTAEKLHISLTTLDTYTRNGFLDAVKLGHRVLYRSEDIENSIERVNSIKHKTK